MTTKSNAIACGSRIQRRGRALLALAASLGCAADALAQQPAADAAEAVAVGEVIVTARRREESLKQVSTSLSVFTAARLEQNGIDGLDEYFLKTPNVSIEETGSRNENRISIRGVSNIGGGLNSSFAFYVDEFNVESVTSNPQLQDIERIEVLRGPQGTFFGRNSAGGAINVITRKPTNELEASGFAGFGRYNTWEASAVLNLPVVTDRFALRAVGYYSETDGSVKNANPAGGSDSQEYLNARLAARITPSDRLTLDLSAQRTDEKSGLETGVPTHVLSPGTIGLIGPVPFTDGLGAYPQNRTRVNNDNPKSTEYDFSVLTARVQYDAEAFSITSISGYIEGGRDQNGDVDATSLDGINLRRNAEPETYSQELRIASRGERRLEWVVGGLFANQQIDIGLEVVAGAQNPLGAPAGTVVRLLDEDDESKSSAAFGELDWKATDRLTLTYGGRYSRDEISQEQVISFATPIGPITQVFPRQSKSFSEYTSRFAMTFDLNDDVTAYAVASQGYKAGGVQLDPSLVEPSFRPETLWNYEGGFKGTLLDRHLWFAASAFYIDWKDLQVRTLVNGIDPDTGAFIIVEGTQNAAKASSRGVELELQAKPSPAVELGATVGYLDAKFDRYERAIVAGLGPVDLSGRRLLNAPKWTLSADAQYNFRVGESDAFLRGEWSHRSGTTTDTIAYLPQSFIPIPGLDFSFPFNVPSFEVWNFRAGIERGRISVSAYVENAFDENYYTGTFDDLFWSGVHVRVHPRTYGMRISARY